MDPEKHDDVCSKRCDIDGCNRVAGHGDAGDNMVWYCAGHAEPDQVYKRGVRCGIDGCDITASYGRSSAKEWSRPLCLEHAFLEIQARWKTTKKRAARK